MFYNMFCENHITIILPYVIITLDFLINCYGILPFVTICYHYVIRLAAIFAYLCIILCNIVYLCILFGACNGLIISNNILIVYTNSIYFFAFLKNKVV